MGAGMTGYRLTQLHAALTAAGIPVESVAVGGDPADHKPDRGVSRWFIRPDGLKVRLDSPGPLTPAEQTQAQGIIVGFRLDETEADVEERDLASLRAKLRKLGVVP